ncbi:hypothetical protein H6P81_019580 [Aristolochia fimbriata]|uniref:Uncharacterized protein n=1 Tax=Aristolochia fimbriata TaxID=158543 RepID=A0AAV7DS16_ARIFI|nr:hypothetical protein H6P81_019580 [Aristolochia fimbriata]
MVIRHVERFYDMETVSGMWSPLQTTRRSRCRTPSDRTSRQRVVNVNADIISRIGESAQAQEYRPLQRIPYGICTIFGCFRERLHFIVNRRTGRGGSSFQLYLAPSGPVWFQKYNWKLTVMERDGKREKQRGGKVGFGITGGGQHMGGVSELRARVSLMAVTADGREGRWLEVNEGRISGWRDRETAASLQRMLIPGASHFMSSLPAAEEDDIFSDLMKNVPHRRRD